jgi:FKBP-type peptidyl-prolyl cis-trans isomerase
VQELQRTRQAAVSAKAAAAGVAFLDKASKEAGVTKTTSGIVIKQTEGRHRRIACRHRPGEGALRRPPHRRQGFR